MYAICIIRYRKPMEDVLKMTEEHRSYLKVLRMGGLLLASGPFDPRTGGALLLRLPDDDPDTALYAVRDGDPFVQSGTAQYEMLKWAPTIGRDELDRL